LCSPSATSFPIDPETIDASVFDYGYASEDSIYLSSIQASNPPLIIPISPIPFSLMLALDFATVIDCSYFYA
jgi:hypothetical protein